jgi:hypothetical protein
VHVVYAAAAFVALPFYVFFALRLLLCRGDVGSLKAILDAKRDAGRGVVQECYMGAFTRSAKSMVVDITVLVNNFLLVWWPHVFCAESLPWLIDIIRRAFEWAL